VNSKMRGLEVGNQKTGDRRTEIYRVKFQAASLKEKQ